MKNFQTWCTPAPFKTAPLRRTPRSSGTSRNKTDLSRENQRRSKHHKDCSLIRAWMLTIVQRREGISCNGSCSLLGHTKSTWMRSCQFKARNTASRFRARWWPCQSWLKLSTLSILPRFKWETRKTPWVRVGTSRCKGEWSQVCNHSETAAQFRDQKLWRN